MTDKDIHPNVRALRRIYEDLTRLDEYAADDIVLHPANRDAVQVRGKEAVVAKEYELIAATGGTLVMDIHDIVANDYFGAAIGVLRATTVDGPLAAPFCGLWRFSAGSIVEHWENDYDAAMLAEVHSARS